MTVRKFVLSLLALLSIGCGGGSGPTALHFNVVNFIGENVDEETGDVRFTTNLGYDVRLEEAFLVFGHVTLRACDGDATAEDIELTETVAVDLLTEGRTKTEFASVMPDPGSYCGTLTELEDATSDTSNLPESPDLEGSVGYFLGTYVAPGETEEEAFSMYGSGGPISSSILYKEGHNGISKATLGENEGELDFDFEVILSRCLDDIDFAGAPEDPSFGWLSCVQEIFPCSKVECVTEPL